MNGITILTGDCRETLKALSDNSVHCVVTSPPYFGLRDYGCDGQIGLEASPRDFIDQMVMVFREVRRVLREDGTLWLNLGDSYAGSWGAQSRPDGNDLKSNLQGGSMLSARQMTAAPRKSHTGSVKNTPGLKPKDLMGIPWRVAFELQDDGWWLRSEIIWHKPNPMPESVTDRPTKSHEQIFLLTKSADYYYDHVAIQESSLTGDNRRPYGSKGAWELDGRDKSKRPNGKPRTAGNKSHKYVEQYEQSDSEEHRTKAGLMKIADVPWERRNKRTVWTVSTKPYKGAHFATFPPDLIEPCILAGTSEHGACAKCGAPWERVTEKTFVPQADVSEQKRKKGSRKGLDVTSGWSDTPRGSNSTKTTGWQPTCECGVTDVVPCVVLDPFGGSGTTGQVARDAGCHAILCELNPKYVELIEQRLAQGSLLV